MMKADSLDADGRLLRTHKRGPGAGLLTACAAVVIAISALAGWLLWNQQSGSIPGFKPTNGGAVLRVANRMPGLIHGVTITTAGRDIRLQRDGDDWRLASLGGYPVPPGRVAPLIGGLGELRTTYVSTMSPPAYAVYGLDDVDKPTGQAVRLTVHDDEGEVIGRVTIGNAVSAPGRLRRNVTAVMEPDDSRIWLADGEVEILKAPLGWVDNLLVAVPRERFRRLETVAPDGDKLVVRRLDDGTNVLAEGLPPGGNISEAWLVDEMANAFASVSFADVRRQLPGGGPQGRWRATVTTADGISFVAQLEHGEGGAWTTLRAEAEDGASPGAIAMVEEFNARHADWIYLVGEHVSKYLMTRPQTLMGDPTGWLSPGTVPGN